MADLPSGLCSGEVCRGKVPDEHFASNFEGKWLVVVKRRTIVHQVWRNQPKQDTNFSSGAVAMKL